MRKHVLLTPVLHSLSPSVVAAVMVALSFCRVAFCGEIHDATQRSDLGRVKALLDIDPNLVFSKDHNGMTPLHWAARTGHTDVAKLLLAYRADVNAGREWRQYTIVRSGEFRADANNADPNAKNKYDQTPLHRAAANGYKDVAAFLLAYQANVNAKDDHNCTPLFAAAARGLEDGVAELLLANGAEVNVQDDRGKTPLHEAAGFGHHLAVVLLLADRAEINARDDHGRTPLYEATDMGYKDVIELLRERGGRE